MEAAIFALIVGVFIIAIIWIGISFAVRALSPHVPREIIWLIYLIGALATIYVLWRVLQPLLAALP
jgi:hypothetical protein